MSHKIKVFVSILSSRIFKSFFSNLEKSSQDFLQRQQALLIWKKFAYVDFRSIFVLFYSKSRSSTEDPTSSGSTKGVVPKSIEEPQKRSVAIKKRPKSSKVVTVSATEMKNGFPASGSRSQSMEKHGGLFVQSTKLSLSSSSSSSSVHKPHSKHKKNT